MTTTTAPERAHALFPCSGVATKAYHISIGPEGDGFVVRFAYGRRGSTLQHGHGDGQARPNHDTARKIYDKLVAEKTAKGYSVGEDGVPYQGTEHEPRSTSNHPPVAQPDRRGTRPCG